ncbi:hypothetical protein EFN91_06595 [Lactococcus lactis]|uniref:Uncharacterized protein n=6 Tax=Lactococcus TaxID=1357 RepID=A0AAJ4T319_LACLL|nr:MULTISPECIES: hypothetical protein [Lactococcus]ARR88259.1 hypothetical protein BSR25_2483 [Lactococcus lactis subsp. lactis bv. diacetylactis]MCT3101275.1 hypothetical protein [Lactococcus lactis]QRZ36089.1 hypothetical protein LL223_04065 [Lactococcus lactis subsp. lactis]UXV64666.1 hypothetical protein LLUC047_13705 [Lactococcus cremoris]
MGAITNSNGFFTTGKDDGKNHIERHNYENGNEQKYRKYDPKNVSEVIELSDTKLEDDTRSLAYKKAYELGMKTEEEWSVANSKRSAKRQDKDYSEYVSKTATSLVNQLKKRTAKKTDDNYKADKYLQQTNAIRSNGGLAIYGSLYYISNAEDYDAILDEKGASGLTAYREFERDTLTTFHQSALYQHLHGDTEVRAEIHTAEDGSQHLQTSEMLGEINGRGAFRIAPVSVKARKLVELYESLYPGSGQAHFESDIALEKIAMDSSKKRNETKGGFNVYSEGAVINVKRQHPDKIENVRKSLFDDADFNKNPRKGDLVKRLFRRVENRELEKIAITKAKEHGVSWSRSYGRSDGVYRGKAEYKAKRKALELEREYKAKHSLLERRESVLDDRLTSADELTKQAEEERRSAENMANNNVLRSRELDHREKEQQKQKQHNDNILIRIKERERAVSLRESALDSRQAGFKKEKEEINNQFAERENRLNTREKNIDKIIENKVSEKNIYFEKVQKRLNRAIDIIINTIPNERLRQRFSAYIYGEDTSKINELATKSVKTYEKTVNQIVDDDLEP